MILFIYANATEDVMKQKDQKIDFCSAVLHHHLHCCIALPRNTKYRNATWELDDAVRTVHCFRERSACLEVIMRFEFEVEIRNKTSECRISWHITPTHCNINSYSLRSLTHVHPNVLPRSERQAIKLNADNWNRLLGARWWGQNNSKSFNVKLIGVTKACN